jgi:RNA polymerase sigma-70 factor (ECF subfamily)
MHRFTERKDEIEVILRNFSCHIQKHILKFNPQKNGIDPEDLSQEIKIKIWRTIEDEKKIKNYSSYIKKIVDSTVIDHIRKFKRRERILNNEKQNRISEQESYYAAHNPYRKDPRDIVGKAVGSLRESRQKVVRLYLLNMTIEEIAISLNWSKDKTRNLLYRGLADLKKMLGKKSIDYES